MASGKRTEDCKCFFSTFIDEKTITRGTGQLSDCGLWEFPCPHGNDMAEEWDEKARKFVPAAEAL